jgi:hypothetical protein
MNSFKVSHEVPLVLLEQNKNWSDYEYILPHLLDQYPEYEYYMREAKAEGRYIIMDNSLHELGTPYNQDRLFYWIEELQPDEFIVPDHWQDMNKTIASAEEWLFYQLDFPNIKFVSVVQANNLEEGLQCFSKLYHIGYNKIAISYGASWYNDLSTHPNPNFAKMLGRVAFVNKISKHHSINTKYGDIELHLLGCQLPQEFSYYNHIKAIKTIDTSNPVIAGAEGTQYKFYGLTEKPKTKIDEIMNKPGDFLHNLAYIIENVSLFRKINNIQ